MSEQFFMETSALLEKIVNGFNRPHGTALGACVAPRGISQQFVTCSEHVKFGRHDLADREGYWGYDSTFATRAFSANEHLHHPLARTKGLRWVGGQYQSDVLYCRRLLL